VDLVLDVERRADDRIVLLDDDFLLVGACASERGQRVTAALASSNAHAHARTRTPRGVVVRRSPTLAGGTKRSATMHTEELLLQSLRPRLLGLLGVEVAARR